MVKIEAQNRQLLMDIRAPEKFKLINLNGGQWSQCLLLLISDILALASAWKIAATLNNFYSPIPAQLIWWVWWGIPSLFWIFAALTILFFAYSRLYHTSFTQSQNYVCVAQLTSLVYLLSLIIIYFYDPKLDPPRSLFFTAWFGSIFFIIGFRLITTIIGRQLTSRQQKTLVFIVAPENRLNKLIQVIQKCPNYKIVGTAIAGDFNTPETLEAITKSKAIEVVAQDLPETKLASSFYWELRRLAIELRLVPSSLDMLNRRGIPEIFAGIPTLRLDTHLLIGWDYRLKRWLDIIGAFLGLILLSPLFIIVAIAIKITSPGPVFFRQERIGLHGKVFQMWKFRTMVVNAHLLQAQLEAQNQSKDGVLFKIKKDPRITPMGNFLRKTSIDELPQLFNILLGQMSLVGPRPLTLRDVERFEKWHHIRHQVLPGITGLWQISGRSDLDDFNDAAALDLYYIDNWSLNLDLDILIETIRIVLFGKGAY